MKLETFDDVVKAINTKGRPFHLLLGNGFSMSYDAEIFSYNALHGFIEKTNDELLTKLFNIVNTKNFELIMQQLDNFAALIEAFDTDSNLKGKIEEASQTLKNSLMDAINSLHPEHVFKIPDENSASCSKFLNLFLKQGGNIYTSNYDLLLYWVLMRNQIENSIDGFGRDPVSTGEYVPEDQLEFSELVWGKYKDKQTIFYLHGALPLFDTGIDIVKEEYDTSHYLLENIRARIERKEYPIFVTAGNGNDKLKQIMHNRYLSYCYDKFSNTTGSLVTFGFNFGEYDEHIIEAVNIAAKHGKKVSERLWSIYIGVYSDEGQKHIESIAHKFACKVHIYDAKTVNVWR